MRPNHKVLNKLSSKKKPYKSTYIQAFSRIHSDLWNVKLKPGFASTDKMPFISSLKVNIYIAQLSMDWKYIKSHQYQVGNKKCKKEY